VRDGRMGIDKLVDHARQVLGVAPPRTLQEFNRFRSAWVAPLKDAGFTAMQIDNLLGFKTPTDRPGRARAKARVRRAYGRQAASRKRTLHDLPSHPWTSRRLARRQRSRGAPE
jgi:hypothetical protein